MSDVEAYASPTVAGHAASSAPTSGPVFGRGFARTFVPGRLSLGMIFPIEAYPGAVATMRGQVELAQRAEALGFAALWVRDVPLLDPYFGDAGQIYDPWVYLGYITAHTRAIALGTASIIVPLRHPLHMAKAAASVDQLSGGRLVLGIASGDRPIEYPAFGRAFEARDATFRESVHFFQRALGEEFPDIESPLGHLAGADLIPKPVAQRIPLLVTGHSRQSLEWIAEHSDGWITYPYPLHVQVRNVEQWRRLTEPSGAFKPFVQAIHFDLATDPDEPPSPIHNGLRMGRNLVLELLGRLQEIGVNHLIINLKHGRRPAPEVLEELGSEVLPHFPTHSTGDGTHSSKVFRGGS